MNGTLWLSEGLRMLKRARNVRQDGIKRWGGSPWQICASIVEANWNGKYFTTSIGNYKQFYSRDFGMCTESLIRLGYRREVKETLHYALLAFKREGRITTHLSPDGKTIDFPSHTPESLAYILHAIALAKHKDFDVYQAFIEKQVRAVYGNDIEKKTGLIRSDKNFSSMKDHAKRKAPCYLTCMLGMISMSLDRLGWDNPFKSYDYPAILEKYYWNGEYYNDDLTGNKHVAGDANTFPFWTGLVKDKNRFEKCLSAMTKAKLDKPIPLRYTKEKVKGGYLFFPSLIMPNWEGNTVWLHLGCCFIEVVARYDKMLLNDYLNKCEKLVTTFRTFPEVLNPDGSLYSLPWYYCDEGMLWCAIPLSLRD